MRNFKKTLLGAVAVCAFLCAPLSMTAQSLSPSTKWHWDKGTIVVETPERSAGQESALGMTLPKMKGQFLFLGI